MSEEDQKEAGTFEKIVSPHDKIVKDFLSEQETAKSFFQEYLPEKITKNLDFDTLKISKDTFVDKKLSGYFSDLLYHIKLNNMAAFIYLLIEHKSKEELLTGFQLLKYMVRIWELYLKQNKKAKTLPVILPIVIYHGAKKWQIDTNFLSLFNAPECAKDYIPDFSYNLHDISHLPDEEIKGAVLLRILFKTLKYFFKPQLRHKLPEIFQLFLELNDKNKGTEYLEVLLRYLATSARALTEEELKESVTQIFEEGGDFMATIAEKWIERGKWDVVKNSLKEGLPINTIVRITGLPAEEINRMKEEMAKSKSSAPSGPRL
jgi:predicted transposase/invertase (TIGR01784 family)